MEDKFDKCVIYGFEVYDVNGFVFFDFIINWDNLKGIEAKWDVVVVLYWVKNVEMDCVRGK